MNLTTWWLRHLTKTQKNVKTKIYPTNLWCRFCEGSSNLWGHSRLLHVSHLQLLQSCLQLHRVCTGPLCLEPTLHAHTQTHLNTLTDWKCLTVLKWRHKSFSEGRVEGGLTSPAGQQRGCLCWRRASVMGSPSSSLSVSRPAGFSSSSPAAPQRSSSFCQPLAPQIPFDPLHSWDDPVQNIFSSNSGSVFCLCKTFNTKLYEKVIAFWGTTMLLMWKICRNNFWGLGDNKSSHSIWNCEPLSLKHEKILLCNMHLYNKCDKSVFPAEPLSRCIWSN